MKSILKALAIGAVALSCAADASAAVAEKAAKKNYLRFTSETSKLKNAIADAGEEFMLEIGVEASSTKLTFTAKDLPKGLSIDKKTGLISGKPKKPGSYATKVTVKDGNGLSASLKFKIKVFVPEWSKGNYTGRF